MTAQVSVSIISWPIAIHQILADAMGTSQNDALLLQIQVQPTGIGQQQQQQQQQPPQPPNILTTSSSSQLSGRPEKISFHLKTSIFTRRVTIDSDKMALGLIKQLAIAFLNEIYFQHQYPTNTYIGDYIRKHFSTNGNLNSLFERLVLRKYDSEQGTFTPFNSASDIGQESYISIEISEKQPAHLLSSSNATIAHSTSTLSSASASPSTYQLKISHEFHQESYFMPTHCASCSALIKGVFRQGFQCSYCKKNYCPKCKNKAEASGEGCLALTPTTSTSTPSTASSSNVSTAGQQCPGNYLAAPKGQNHTVSQSTQSAVNNADGMVNSESHTNGASGNTNSGDVGNKAEGGAHFNMSKRKSASNLLHFTIGNPFKSHHNQQQSTQQPHQMSPPVLEARKSMRGSTGALDPILQQLNKQIRDQEHMLPKTDQAQVQPKNNNNHQSDAPSNLLGVQVTQLSSSHQNLYTNNENKQTSDIKDVSLGSSSAKQSPSKGNPSQLSSSARTSTRDLVHSTSPTLSSNHSFICTDWTQVDNSTDCGVCNKTLSRHTQQKPPVICKSCKLQVHAQCQKLALADCLLRINELNKAAVERSQSGNRQETKSEIRGTSSNVSRDNIRLHRLAPSVKHIKRPDSTKPIIEGWLQHRTVLDDQPRKHYWRLDETDITLYENDTSTRYFKAIALNKITRLISAGSLPKYIKEAVVLSSGQQLSDSNTRQAKSANASPVKTSEFKSQMKVMFAFEVVTGSVFMVQASDENEATKWKNSLEAITAKRALETGRKNEQDVKAESSKDGEQTPSKTAEAANKSRVEEQQLVDLENVEADKPKPPSTRHHHHHHHHPPSSHRVQRKTYTDPNRSRLYNRPRIVINLNPMSIPDHWIEGKYLIERDRVKGVGFEELGSGQFGKVYAAISEIKAENPSKGLWSGVPVAIKEISKSRFDLQQQAKLKNEANILSRLDHPGVIILERVHDLPDKIYIVMEQLEDDMLEMIVSTEDKRLSERVTKFLTYQILEALKYLHLQNIAHCDLKPENVLLVERRSQFPQIKLCDFGFAKIIEENSFRKSLVGTPAYLAPEVVMGQRYNRSVDLWSVGVIVYVSLSGEFPFNEEENIPDQISRANFLYPEQPWGNISSQAKNFINSLLRLHSDKRLSASRAQMDDWIQDYQLWCDLCELEVRVGKRWVTDDADYERWSRYAAERNLQVPRSALQLHDQLIGD